MIAKASTAYQIVLQATKNKETECMAWNSKFCSNAYSGLGKQKMKTAKTMYQKSRSQLMDVYEDDAVPDWLTKQLPAIV